MTSHPARPDPDQLLIHIQAEEQQQSRGRLKIFLGYAAGVGKTYAMLEAAHQRQAEGMDVVIGYVETHRRVETEELVAGLELIPRKQTEYRGTHLPEMDVDAVLARRPGLVLVDEFAHTNAPGSRHPKRYQDVEELLAAGIDVYTTLNIQHLESLNDVVAQITGVVVHETVPDSVIDAAAEIELIDLPPAELLQRLKEGKVYVPEQAARAIEKFFRQGNLTALREMAMRRAAKRVDEQMRAYMRTHAIPGTWQASDRLMVCIGPGPLSDRLVRTTRRLANELNAEWFAVYVETTDYSHLSPTVRDQVARHLQLAEELGARIKMLPGASVSEAVLNYARKHNVTKIIVGKPMRPRWEEWLRGSVVDQLVRMSGVIDVYVVSSADEVATARPTVDASQPWFPHRPYRRYLQSAGLVMGATLLGFLVDPGLTLSKWYLAIEGITSGMRPLHEVPPPQFEPTNLVMIFLTTVVIAALYLGRGPAILASALSVVSFDFFFVVPYLTFAVSDTQYVVTFIGLFAVGLVISSLAARAREQTEAARTREAQTGELYDLSRDLASAAALETILQTLIRHVEQTFGREVVVLLPNEMDGKQLETRAASENLKLDEQERAVADWVFRHGEQAGRNTNTLGAARLRYLPLKTARGVVGVLGIMRPAESEHLSPEQHRLMEAFASQSAVAIERAKLDSQARKAEILQATEKLQSALLNSISHDLRTPLVSITGALSSLEEDGTGLDEDTRQRLVRNARGEAERLNRLVGNLLEMTRLEAGALKLKEDVGDIQDAIGAALNQLGNRLDNRQVMVDVADGVPLVPMDFVMIVQVLVNLLDNAFKYSPIDQSIEVQARAAGGHVEVSVADRGIGIPPADLQRVFDKFFRVQHPGSVSGTGLGLSICKGIIEAHGGFIVAENRAGGGTVITFALPIS